MKRIVQFSAGFNDGDAISNYMRVLKDKFQNIGIPCEIYSQNIGFDDRRICKKFPNYKPRKGDCIIYHHSIHSKILDFLSEQDSSIFKVLVYHNVTPHEYMLPYDLTLTYYLKKGREELAEYKNFFDKNFAVSDFNKQELEDIGYNEVKVLPLILSFDKIPTNIEKDGLFRILFVGRIAPNKKQCDLVRLAKVLKDYYPIHFKVSLVGHTSREMVLYREEIENLIKYFGVGEEVEILDFLNRDDLNKIYTGSDLFLCMSEHEGFCVPLMEAMHFQLPILAYAGGAVPETLDGSGILFYEKKYDQIAELVNRIAEDTILRDQIIGSQNRRLSEFQSLDTFGILKMELGLENN